MKANLKSIISLVIIVAVVLVASSFLMGEAKDGENTLARCLIGKVEAGVNVVKVFLFCSRLKAKYLLISMQIYSATSLLSIS